MMKKLLLLSLAMLLCLALCACGTAAEDIAAVEEPAEEATESDLNMQDMTPVEDYGDAESSPADAVAAGVPEEPVSDADAAVATDEMTPATGTDADDALTDEEQLAAAQEYVGATAEEFIAAFGQPNSSEYAASCLEENAEDGMLMYDSFYVWTVRTDTDEIVHAVYSLDE